jgi:hypothetical protein
MRRLFRSFERSAVDYLLISGQASVLYGAATFSEDIDIWIRPSRLNLARLLRSLAACRARVHKLTPPLTLGHAEAGHGFHFLVPARPQPAYLDVMAAPPRVRSFDAARRRARAMATDWGLLPVVSIEDLVALKQTRRLSDYEVISNLVQARLAETPRPSRRVLLWAARHCYRAEDKAALLARLGARRPVKACRREIAREIARLQERDVRHWSSRLRKLRFLRRQGLLWPEGALVGSL